MSSANDSIANVIVGYENEIRALVKQRDDLASKLDAIRKLCEPRIIPDKPRSLRAERGDDEIAESDFASEILRMIVQEPTK
jgi:hypothetical protein